jgi:predicted transcriptional regulator
MIWNGIPTIRKELAETLITHFGLSQCQAAEKLGITPSAVCQYRSKKRGKTDSFDETILQEITYSAERIMKSVVSADSYKKQNIPRLYSMETKTKKIE